MRLVLLLLVCLVSGCNTRIGFPGIHYGLWASIGVLAICFLILTGIILVGDGADSPSEDDRRGGFVVGAGWCIVAGLLLQALPHTESGIQFVPLLPWHYTGWLARVISIICWLGIIAGFLKIRSSSPTDQQGAAGAVLVAMAFNALLSFATPAGVTADTPPTQSVEAPITQWERLRDEQKTALDKLLSDREELITRIRNLGARSKKELMANPVGQTLVTELEQLCQQIDTAKKEIGVIETAIERAQSRRRSIERQALPKLTGEEYERMSVVHHTLEDERRQPPGSDIRRDRLLDELFREEK